MTPLQLSAFTATTCLGTGAAALAAGLREQGSGLQPCRFETVELPTWVGEVAGVDGERLPARLQRYDCRNNRLARLGLEADDFADRLRSAIDTYGRARIGVFIGTSTAGILQTELAYRARDSDSGALPDSFDYRHTHNSFSPAEFVRDYFGLEGIAMAISTACSSSAKVFAAAARQLALGTIDAAVVGGVDSLCLTTLYGFSSLQLTSREPCRPFDRARDGISVGEAAAFVFLERAPTPMSGAILLSGYGESSDAYHMSSPHPDGLGAQWAMHAALQRAQLQPGQIDYINLHGTATPANDAAESKAVQAVFGPAMVCSSTKGATGHTLGAAGAVEAVICALSLQHGWLPSSVGTISVDPALQLDYLQQPRALAARHLLSNSFGFGGSNCSLIFSRHE